MCTVHCNNYFIEKVHLLCIISIHLHHRDFLLVYLHTLVALSPLLGDYIRYVKGLHSCAKYNNYVMFQNQTLGSQPSMWRVL